MESNPLEVRRIGYVVILAIYYTIYSRRTLCWVRGLKLKYIPFPPVKLMSHPLLGAWIEIIRCPKIHLISTSHPLLGAWIEIYFHQT